MYYDIQISENVDAGISNAEMRDIDMLIASYLSGDARAIDGAGFGERALIHMEDVYNIFETARVVRLISLFAALALLMSAMNKNRARRLRIGSYIALAAFVLPLTAFGIWAVMDFEAAFEGMHKLLFSNDLYRLQSTELLIRLLPERFFMEIGKKLALRCGLAALAVPLIMSVFDTKVNVIGKIFGKGAFQGK